MGGSWAHPPRRGDLTLPVSSGTVVATRQAVRRRRGEVVQALHGREEAGDAGALASAEARAAEWPEIPAQTVIGGRYSIEKEIGRGGMGRVFSAVDLRLGRRVAVKVLPPGTHTTEQLRRFEVEARAAASLQQPNIIDVYDVGVDSGGPYIVSELLEGKTLRERLAEGALPTDDALRYARQLAAGLAAAHANGVIHRDLKPENLFITRDERLKILDFGIAKLLANGGNGSPPEASSTGAGGLVGTAAYMSPEQVRGAAVDHRSDLFSFGAILHEMLSGAPAFAGGSAVETGYAVLSSQPKALPRGVPRKMAGIVARCLEKSPAARYPDAASLRKDLDDPALESAAARTWSRALPWAVAGTALAAAFALSWPRIFPVPPRHLVVLPFPSVGGGAAQEAFAEGLSEFLTNKLRQIGEDQRTLDVVSASDVRRDRVKDARAARAAFGVTLALEGNVRWSDNTALVAIQLLDILAGRTLGARNIEVPKDQLASLQTLLVERTADLLEFQPPPKAKAAPDAPSAPAAYEYYVQGRGYLQRYDRIENVETAVGLFDQAIAIDPSYAVAQAGRAEALLRLFRITRDPEMMARASASANRAVELNGRLAPVHVTMGLVQFARGKYDEAIASFQRALELEPRNVDAQRELANTFGEAGRYADAEKTYRRAIELGENSWAAYKDLAVFLIQRGRLADSVPYLERVVQLTPDNYSGYSNLGGIYVKLGRVDDAEKMLRKSLSLRPTANAYTNLGSLAYYSRHDYPQASEMFRKAIELKENDDRLWGALADSYRWIPGREGEAPAAFRHALGLIDREVALDPTSAQLRSRRAVYLSALKEHARAQEEIKQALIAAPGDGQVLLRAAIVHEQGGRREEARKALESALRAGYSLNEIVNAPPLRTLREDPAIARLIAERSQPAPAK
jgi:eukaryotic-like serine/threonine-protein kinase